MADLGDGLLGAWVAATRLAGPVGRAIVAYRRRSGKEHPTRWRERLGRASLAVPARRSVVWVHAASVGEAVTILPLVSRLVEEGAFVVLTTVTTTSAEVVADRLPPGVAHQFVPVDIAGAVGLFLDTWRPRLAVFVESEIWPVSLALLARRRIPVVIANARLSDRSFRRWRRVPFVARALFGRVTLALAQTPDDAARYAALGTPRAAVVGNVKLDAPAPEAAPDAAAALAAALAGRPVFLAASTHPGEEAIALAVHRQLAERHPDLLTILAPRHPVRGEEVAALAAAAGLPVARRGAGALPGRDVAVYVADTVGELGTLYRLATAAFVGGSFGGVGGHNPVEAVRAGTALVTGPDVANNREVFAILLAAGGAEMAATEDALADAVGRLIADPALRARRIAAASAAVDAGSGALARSVEALRPFLAGEGAR